MTFSLSDLGVIKLWEVDPQELLQYEGLLLCRAASGEELLREVAERVQGIAEPQQKRETLNACRILAGLRYNKNLVNQLLKENDMMEQSVIYQDILQRGLHSGLQHERQLVLRLLERAIGQVPPRARRQVEQFDFDQLAMLGESLFDFKSGKELSAWLKQHAARR